MVNGQPFNEDDINHFFLKKTVPKSMEICSPLLLVQHFGQVNDGQNDCYSNKIRGLDLS